jgi:tetratricopeptide (TPR) repeat protein
MFIVAAGALLLYAAFLWFFVRGDSGLRDKAGANWIAFAGFWALAAWVALSTRAQTGIVREGNVIAAFGLLAALLVIVAAIIIAIPFWMHLVGLFAEGGIRSVLGIERMKVEKTFDVADKAEHEKRYDDAIKLYLVAAAEAPAEPEPFRRAGDAALKNGATEEALDYFKCALARTTNPEDVASLAFRIAELLARTLGRRDEARQTLEKTATQLAGTRFEQFARDRINSLA